MKKFVKALVLAPVMLVALTACESKMSNEKAQERAKGYDSAVLANYENVTVATKYSNVKAEGTYESRKDSLKDGEVTQQPEECFCTEAAIKSLEDGGVGGIQVEGLTMETKTTVEYYSYKKTGLKIVVKTVGQGSFSGVTYDSKGTGTYWVLDDGRIEKAETTNSVKTEGTMTVVVSIDMSGSMSYTAKSTYTWNAKQ